jgi:predicted HTH transcriptional regulator
VERGRIHPLQEIETVARLGEGVQKNGALLKEAMDRGFQTLAQYLKRCHEMKTQEIIEGVRKWTEHGVEMVSYPPETLHEIITNAVLHRDYGIADDISVRIFDDRVEVESLGFYRDISQSVTF